LLDAATGQPITPSLQHQTGVQFAAFSPDGVRVITASGKTAQLWDANTGQALGRPLEHQHNISHAAFSPDGRQIVTASDGEARVWDAASGVAVTPDGGKVCFAVGKGADWSVKVWDLEAGKELLSWKASTRLPVWGVAWSGDGKWIATGGVDQQVRVWHAATG